MAAQFGCTVAELLERIDASELVEWQAYQSIYGPVGPTRFDHLFALLTAVVFNAAGPKDAKKPIDFLVPWDRGLGRHHVVDPAAAAAQTHAVMLGVGGRIRD